MVGRFNSKQYDYLANPDAIQYVCGAPILPLRFSPQDGPCPAVTDEAFHDIISEAISMFRILILLKGRFDIDTPADKILIYVALWIHKCLQIAVADKNDKHTTEKYLLFCAQTDLALPKDEDFPLNQLFSAPKDAQERELCQRYFKELRVQAVKRFMGLMFDDYGMSKWWAQYAEYQFMNRAI